MNRFGQGRRGLAAIVVAVFVSSATAQSITNLTLHSHPPSVPVAIMPLPASPLPPAPIDYFRNLLAMSPEQRESVLANKPARIRERILAKGNEYAALAPNE